MTDKSHVVISKTISLPSNMNIRQLAGRSFIECTTCGESWIMIADGVTDNSSIIQKAVNHKCQPKSSERL